MPPRPPPSAKHPYNFRLVSHLRERLETVDPASNFRYTLRRAIGSLICATHPILTRDDARQLPYIGEYLATEIELFLLNNDPPTPEANAAAAAAGRLVARNGRQQAPSGALIMESISAGEEEEGQVGEGAGGGGREERWRGSKEMRKETGRGRGRGRGRGKGGRVRVTRENSYVPQYRSGGFAILIALILGKRQDAEHMFKAEIMETGQPYCDEPMEASGGDTSRRWFGGWESQRTLYQHKLIDRKLRGCEPAWYWLTEAGERLAEQMWVMHQDAQRRTANGFGADAETVDPTVEKILEVKSATSAVGKKRGRPSRSASAEDTREGGVRLEGGSASVSNVGAYVMGAEFGKPGDRAASGVVERSLREAFKEAAKRLKFSDAQVRRAANVIEKLERDSETREDCLLVLGQLFVDRAIPRSEDQLFEKISAALWQKCMDDTNKQNLSGSISIRLPQIYRLAVSRTADVQLNGNRLPASSLHTEPFLHNPSEDVTKSSQAQPSATQASTPLRTAGHLQNGTHGAPPFPSSNSWVAVPIAAAVRAPARQDRGDPPRKSNENATVIIDLDGDCEDVPYPLAEDVQDGIVMSERSKEFCAQNKFSGLTHPIPHKAIATNEVLEIIDDDDVICTGDASFINADDGAQLVATPEAGVNPCPPRVSEPEIVQTPASSAYSVPGTNTQTCSLYLVLDSMERTTRTRSDAVHTISELLADNGVRNVVRPLPCGDALFIAKFSEEIEVVLDYVVERKTLEDFAGSLLDGRVSRQSFMLRQSQLGKRMFVLEGEMKKYPRLEGNKEFSRKLAELEIFDDFYVKHTKDLMDTIWFYASMFRRLKDQFESMPLSSVLDGRCLYQNWIQRMQGLKSGLTLDQLFILQLCQCKGVGKDSATALIRMGYDTPQALFRALDTDTTQTGNGDVFSKGIEGINARTARIIKKIFTSTDYGTEVITASRPHQQ